MTYEKLPYEIFNVMHQGKARYLRLENEKDGVNLPEEYYRILDKDGVYTALPVPEPKQPISCQQGTPLGGIEK